MLYEPGELHDHIGAQQVVAHVEARREALLSVSLQPPQHGKKRHSNINMVYCGTVHYSTVLYSAEGRAHFCTVQYCKVQSGGQSTVQYCTLLYTEEGRKQYLLEEVVEELLAQVAVARLRGRLHGVLVQLVLLGQGQGLARTARPSCR